MKKKPLMLFFCIGLIALICGLFLLNQNHRAYGVGFTTLGVMWIVICIGLATKLKKTAPCNYMELP